MKDKMAVALRVLICVENHTDPLRTDIEALKGWVDPSDRAADPDELVCIVIMSEIQRRQSGRAK